MAVEPAAGVCAMPSVPNAFEMVATVECLRLALGVNLDVLEARDLLDKVGAHGRLQVRPSRASILSAEDGPQVPDG